VKVREQDGFASHDPPLGVDRWWQLGRQPLDPLRAERATFLVLPSERLQVEVVRRHQPSVGQDSRGVSGQRVDPNVDLGANHLARVRGEHLCGHAGALEVQATRDYAALASQSCLSGVTFS
jgi:hypothetical protein